MVIINSNSIIIADDSFFIVHLTYWLECEKKKCNHRQRDSNPFSDSTHLFNQTPALKVVFPCFINLKCCQYLWSAID